MKPQHCCRYIFSLIVILLFCTHSQALLAQNGLPTTTHWGGNLIPELAKSRSIALHLTLFSEFGPYPRDPASGDCDESMLPPPYNHINTTIGMNMLSYSAADTMSSRSRHSGRLYRQNTFFLGWAADGISDFLQNDIFHRYYFIGEGLCRVPRDGDSKNGLLAGTSWQIDYQFATGGTSSDDKKILNETPFFMGGGLSISTIFQDGFIHAGMKDFTIWPGFLRRYLPEPFFGENFLQVSGAARLGVTYPGFIFSNLAPGYTIRQAAIRFNLEIAGLPVGIEIRRVAHSGLFLLEEFSRRRFSSRNEIPVLKETFTSARIILGSLVFEGYNDSAGGKDSGPTFGINAKVEISPDSVLARKTN